MTKNKLEKFDYYSTNHSDRYDTGQHIRNYFH